MKPFHIAPIFCCDDTELLDRFFKRYSITRNDEPLTVMKQCAKAFSGIPYENLTKIIKSDRVLSANSALRFPAEVLADHLKWGTGGTCFSLTAALIAVFNALGFNAQPLLADRRYGPDTHCGLAVMHGKQMLLIDPGYLLFIPTPMPSIATSVMDLGHAAVELRPLEGGARIELTTIVRGNRKTRLTYKRSPVDAATFKRAWTDSFTWEMMTYPVLTRCIAGQHLYLRGASATIRTHEGTDRSELELSEQMAFITGNMGVAHEVVLRAWGVMRHGATGTAFAG
jgi:arylamine N-acetyltransferase